ncbi:hypothetical protein GCM10010245_87150 [Streptomyces spectabilis]|nr:hypothetical protein GCM10010245_87150 [Streptomyces spectabilis]
MTRRADNRAVQFAEPRPARRGLGDTIPPFEQKLPQGFAVRGTRESAAQTDHRDRTGYLSIRGQQGESSRHAFLLGTMGQRTAPYALHGAFTGRVDPGGGRRRTGSRPARRSSFRETGLKRTQALFGNFRP